MRWYGPHAALEKHEAELVLSKARAIIENDPNDADMVATIGHCLNILEQDEEALPYFERAVALPNPHPYIWFKYALILRQCGRYEEAFPYLWNAWRYFPEDRYLGHTYAEELIRRGKWLKAWPLAAKYRWSKDKIKSAGVPEWQGEDIRGKRLALIFEGGFGDAFWLFRFVPKLIELGALLYLGAGQPIAEFFSGHPWLRNLPEEDGTGVDYWVSIFELLRWLEVSEPYWPGDYIQAQPNEKYRGKIGLCWNCGEAQDPRKFRSMKREQAEVFFKDPNIVSLQYGDNPDLTTWQATAEIISALDLVISVDTAVCHLAGAMGKPTWLVLGGYQDCKWMGEETTGWYPSMRIFRADQGAFNFGSVLPKVERAFANEFPNRILQMART
jgi:tetratricopeptide (TPR) repeat protein